MSQVLFQQWPTLRQKYFAGFVIGNLIVKNKCCLVGRNVTHILCLLIAIELKIMRFEEVVDILEDATDGERKNVGSRF